MPTYSQIKNAQQTLIRKALDGSAFMAPITADAIDTLTVDSATPGTPELAALPTGYDDLGLLTAEGQRFAKEVNTSEVTSFGSVTPTRTDILSTTSTINVAMQETKAMTIGLGAGVDLSAVVADATTGEVSIPQSTRPTAKTYRLLCLAVDEGDGGEIYIARFYPRAKVTGFAEQNYVNGDEALTWGATFTGEIDPVLGYSERWLFGGPGFKYLLADMGIPTA